MSAKKDSAAEGPDPDHLATLKRGVTEWNAWRDAHARALPNFAGADLHDEDLSGANLSGADLSGADLSGADLHEATDSSGSDFSGVSLGETRLADANLRNVRGLEAVRHEGHGTLEHRTRAQSGPLPEGVLTGIGRPEMPDHSLRVEFNESVWRDLFVVEFGLREVLGDQAYSLEKHDDQLTVTFRSPEDFQKGLETVVAQLAAQEQVKPGILVACTLKETDAPLEIGGEQLRRLLGIVAEELRAGKAETQLSVSHTEHEDPQALTTRQDTLHKAVECLPANFAAPLVGRLLEERTVRTREGSMSDIYDRSMLGLQYVNRRMSLEAGAERIPADPAPGAADSEV